jgi:hypothetical protein
VDIKTEEVYLCNFDRIAYVSHLKDLDFRERYSEPSEMAPEDIMRILDDDYLAADMWAIGIVLIRLMSKELFAPVAEKYEYVMLLGICQRLGIPTKQMAPSYYKK